MGGHLRLPGGVEVLSQILRGRSHMGALDAPLPQVDFGFWAAYVLASAGIGPHRLSVRYDRFDVDERDPFRLEDPNEEDGSAWTVAYSWTARESRRLALELLSVRADRPARLGLGLPRRASDVLFQVSYRLTL